MLVLSRYNGVTKRSLRRVKMKKGTYIAPCVAVAREEGTPARWKVLLALPIAGVAIYLGLVLALGWSI